MKQAKKIWAILALAVFANTQAQNYLNYNVGNAHSHNDYMQEIPFWQAYYANFGSIEADVFLVKGSYGLPIPRKNYHQSGLWKTFTSII